MCDKETIQEPKIFYQITLKPMQTNNLPFGDDIMEITDCETILFHNINGLKEETNWHQISTTMAELQVTIYGLPRSTRL
jgi:hypothetical protein